MAGATEALSRSAELLPATGQGIISTLQSLGLVRLLQADFAEAHRLLEQARTIDSGQEKHSSGGIDELAARLALAEGHPAEAAREASLAASLFRENAEVDLQAIAEATNACALLLTGAGAEDARAAADRALALIAPGSSPFARPRVLEADASVQAAQHPRQLESARRGLAELLPEAEHAGRRTDEWELRLTLAQLEKKAGQPRARDHLRTLGRDARAQGFLLFAKQAEESALR